MPRMFEREFKKSNFCQDLISHKRLFLNPSFLEQQGIPYNVTFQEANELIITLPGCYHSGINCGENINSAVNFADKLWIDYAERAAIKHRQQLGCSCEDKWDPVTKKTTFDTFASQFDIRQMRDAAAAEPAGKYTFFCFFVYLFVLFNFLIDFSFSSLDLPSDSRCLRWARKCVARKAAQAEKFRLTSNQERRRKKKEAKKARREAAELEKEKLKKEKEEKEKKRKREKSKRNKANKKARLVSNLNSTADC